MTLDVTRALSQRKLKTIPSLVLFLRFLKKTKQNKTNRWQFSMVYTPININNLGYLSSHIQRALVE